MPDAAMRDSCTWVAPLETIGQGSNFAQFFQSGQRTGHQIRMVGQLVLIKVVHLTGVAGFGVPRACHHAAKPHRKQLAAVQLAFGKAVPQLSVDLVVGFQCFGAVGHAVML